jgi:hypothetical protein
VLQQALEPWEGLANRVIEEGQRNGENALLQRARQIHQNTGHALQRHGAQLTAGLTHVQERFMEQSLVAVAVQLITECPTDLMVPHLHHQAQQLR